MSEKQLKYGQVYGGENGFDVTVATGQTIYRNSLKFVKRTGASTATVTLATQTDSEILGHLEIEEFVTASTNGTEVRKCVDDPTAVFKGRVLYGTYAEYMKGKTCDIIVSSGIQGVCLNSASYNQIIVVDADTTDTGWILVRRNPGGENRLGVV